MRAPFARGVGHDRRDLFLGDVESMDAGEAGMSQRPAEEPDKEQAGRGVIYVVLTILVPV